MIWYVRKMCAMQYRVEQNLQENYSFFRKLPRNLVHQLDHVKISQINQIRAKLYEGERSDLIRLQVLYK